MATHPNSTQSHIIRADLATHLLGALGATTHRIPLPYGTAVGECRHAEHDDVEAGLVDVYLVDDAPYLGVCYTCATYIATHEQVRHVDIRSCESPSILCDDDSAVA
jgi:hypothetical protein